MADTSLVGWLKKSKFADLLNQLDGIDWLGIQDEYDKSTGVKQ